jgi:hypothetical protein
METRPTLLLYLIAVSGYAQSPGTFTETSSMTTARFGHTATLLQDGRVLIAGGYTAGIPVFGQAITATAELYDPANGTFTATGNMTSARAYHTATLLPDGRVLMAAGSVGQVPSVGPEYSLATAELYDPSTGTFTATANMTASGIVETNTATLLSDGQVLMTGSPFDAELYNPDTGTFRTTGNMTVPPPFDTATLLPDGRVLLAAGFFTPKVYDPPTGTFSVTGAGLGVTGRATLLMNGRAMVAGGNDDPGPIADAEVYDPSTGIFAATGNMNAPRANHTATLLPDGKALITGGNSWFSPDNSSMYYFCCLSSAELYDSLSGSFVNTGAMAAGRAGHTATLLNSGAVLIAGGATDGFPPSGNTTAAAEIYHPATPLPAPVLFSLSGDGPGQGAIQHAGTARIASAGDPAVAGEYLSIYLTGLADGSVVPPQVAIGGRLAEITFFGNVPGYAGLNQVNARVPTGVAPGPAVPVRLTYLGRPSNEVTIGVQ